MLRSPLFFFFLTSLALAYPHKNNSFLILAKKEKLQQADIASMRKTSLEAGGKIVPTLIEVVKGNQYSDKARWVSIFLLGRIMGQDALPFISKFTAHPNWILRLASFKTLFALHQTDKFTHYYKLGLKDKSLVIRKQVLSMTKQLKLKQLGPHVWSMLFDKQNYSIKNKKRLPIIKDIVRTLGHLEYSPAAKPFGQMLQDKRYSSLSNDLVNALENITGKKAPQKDSKKYWAKVLRSI